jgi:hypothetical protein
MKIDIGKEREIRPNTAATYITFILSSVAAVAHKLELLTFSTISLRHDSKAVR